MNMKMGQSGSSQYSVRNFLIRKMMVSVLMSFSWISSMITKEYFLAKLMALVAVIRMLSNMPVVMDVMPRSRGLYDRMPVWYPMLYPMMRLGYCWAMSWALSMAVRMRGWVMMILRPVLLRNVL